MRFLRYVRNGTIGCAFFLGACALGIVVVISFGFLGPAGLLLECLAGFALMTLARSAYRKHVSRKPPVSWKQALIELFVFVLFLQAVLLLLVPMSSVVPEGIMSKAGLVARAEDIPCDLSGKLERARSLWGGQIRYDSVNIVQGGLMRNLWILQQRGWLDDEYARSAATFGTTIYLYDLSECAADATFFHEMTHVWQMQHERAALFGITRVLPYARDLYLQAFDPDVLYDYGGYAGLRRALEEHRKFRDFSLEQQASIVEDWWLGTAGYPSGYGESIIPAYEELLRHYVADMVQG